ncbi:MAG: hypothetical protein K1Y36_24175 [Blastocatellia bacterium]|nr:hypothetical protein [Blastocatellia bacterium]
MATTKETVLLLGDCSGLAGGHSLVDLFALAKNLGQTDLGFKVKEAVLVAADSPMLSQIQFWETTCFNRGICVRIFQDREEAIAWLCGFIPKVAKETEIS